jgi:ABC-type cobalamin transport system ATPase subunit
LAGIQTAKNTQWNENHKAIHGDIMTKYEADNPENKKYLTNLSKQQLNYHKNRIQEYEENLLHTGDYVRIRLASTQSQLRQKAKASNKNLIFDIACCSLLSGISDHIDCHKKTVDNNKKQIIVTTISFNDLLEQFNAPLFIDYLSLDTEGSELEILKSVNLQKYIFGLIDVEHNYVEPRRTQIRELLCSNGYEYIKVNACDDCYKYKSK